MLTIFTSCAPFVDEKLIRVQQNAIFSWMNLKPTPEILIMGGREESVKEFADEQGIKVVDTEPTTDSLTPKDAPLFYSTELYFNIQGTLYKTTLTAV